MHKESQFTWKLGMFVSIGLVVFIAAIYFIGKRQNLFGSTFHLKSQFKTVSGLKVGNNVRFSGINVGTVDNIEIINDSTVVVGLIIEEEVQKFIKTDARASIGSDGLMGEKVLTIFPGTSSNKMVKDNDKIASSSAVEMDDLMKSVKISVDNAAVITYQLAEFTYKMNNGNGILSRLMNDKKMGDKVDATLTNLESGTKGLDENMEAAKSNFLLKGYFTKKKKAEEKAAQQAKEKKEKAADSIKKAARD